MQVIDQINGSALFAQSAYSASIATKDSLGQDITATYLTAVDLSNYYTKSETSGATELSNAFGSIVQGDADVNSYVQTNSSVIDEVNASYQTNSGTFLTAHQDLSDYQTIEGMTAYQPVGDYYSASNPSGFISEVPEGTMNTSACEYNAVNEISGYNGSAIAQYGAEKQWLVHDDTLVHAANSAQYALGVNISALQRLMGIDETVLYDGESSGGTLYNNNIPLAESYKNFNTIKIMNGHYSIGEFPSHLLSGNQDAKITVSFQDANTATNLAYGLLRYSATNDTSLIQYFNRIVSFSTANAVTVASNINNYNTRTYKVIGIGRKA